MIRSRDRRDDQKNETNEESSDTDWGFSEGKQGMANETKFALMLICVLIGGGGYFAYDKWNKSDALFSGDEDLDGTVVVTPKPLESDSNSETPETGSGETDPFGFSGSESDGNFGVAQDEPDPDAVDPFWDSSSADQRDNAQPAGQFPQGDNGYPIGQADSSFESGDSRREDSQNGSLNQVNDLNQPANSSSYGFSESEGGFDENSQTRQNEPSQPFGESEDSFSETSAGGLSDTNQVTQQEPVSRDSYDNNRNLFNDDPVADQREPAGGRDEPSGFGFSEESAESNTSRYGQTPEYGAADNARTDEQPSGLFGSEVATETQNRNSENSFSEQANQFEDPLFNREDSNRDDSRDASTVRRGDRGAFGSESQNSGRTTDFSGGQQDGTYEIQESDNYWGISKKQYGTSRYFRALERYNLKHIPDARRMKPGIKILVPSPQVLEASYPDLFPERTVRNPVAGQPASTGVRTAEKGPAGFFRGGSGEPLYRVGKEDTLSGIAQTHLGRSSRWIQVYQMNRSTLPSPNSLKIGTVLRLPGDASHVQLVRDSRESR